MRVMVVDTVGQIGGLSSFYRDYFNDHITIKAFDITDEAAQHPHGFQCGYYAGVLLNLLPGNHELMFCRIFDSAGRPIQKSNEFVLDVIRDQQPDVISNSWGQWDQDTRFGEMMGQVAWHEWCDKFDELTAGKSSYFAAGNNDQNDLDYDLDYPGKLLAQRNSACIGAHRRNGIPSEFSGDDPDVLCSFWAENVQLLTPAGWVRGSGTSFACPKAAGLAAYLMLNTADFKSYAIAHASKPDYYVGDLPNPKWGHGSLEHKYQEKFAMLREELLPPRMSALALSDFYRDFEKVENA